MGQREREHKAELSAAVRQADAVADGLTRGMRIASQTSQQQQAQAVVATAPGAASVRGSQSGRKNMHCASMRTKRMPLVIGRSVPSLCRSRIFSLAMVVAGTATAMSSVSAMRKPRFGARV